MVGDRLITGPQTGSMPVSSTTHRLMVRRFPMPEILEPDGLDQDEFESTNHCAICDSDVPEFEWDDDLEMCIFCSLEEEG